MNSFALPSLFAALTLADAGKPAQERVPLTALDMAFAQFLNDAQPSFNPHHLWLAALVSHQFSRGHACLDLAQLRAQGAQSLGWDEAAGALLPTDLTLAAATLPWAQGPASPLVLVGDRLYLRRNWQAEQAIRASIETRLAQPCVVPEGLADALTQLFPNPAASSAVAQASNSQPDWQKVACALAARGHVTLITGGPGTGKTTTVVRLLGLLQSQAMRHGAPLRMVLAAPTGKAAARLGTSVAQALQHLPPHMQAELPTQAQTLHKLLQVRPGQTANTVALAHDVVVVDEASMIDLSLMARLMAAVPLHAHLILLGDKDQLASVEAGAVMGQLCQHAERGGYSPDTVRWVQATTGQDVGAWAGTGSLLAQHTVMLRQSRRFTAESVIGQWAQAVNTGDVHALDRLWADTPWADDAASSVTRVPPKLSPRAALTQVVRRGWQVWLALLQPWQVPEPPPCNDTQAQALLAAFGQFQVLCAVREGPWGVLALNQVVAQALGLSAQGWRVGRAVMVTRNDYALGLMNGDVGLCLPTSRGLRVAFVQGTVVRWVLPSRLDAVESVFAMTVHKSQGSEFDHVALVLPDRMAVVLTRELLYTGITRAKHCLTLVCPHPAVLRLATRTPTLRSGGLAFDGH